MINFDLVPKSNDPPEFLKFSKISRSFFVSEINHRRRQRQRRQLPRLIASIRKKRKHRNHRWISRLNRSTIFSIENGPVRAASGSKVAISRCQEPESGMSGDIDRGSNPRGGSTRFSLARGNGACARTFSCSRVREERGDGVKHSTTPDGQGVTTRSPDLKTIPFLHERVPADSRSRFLVDRHGSRVSRRDTIASRWTSSRRRSRFARVKHPSPTTRQPFARVPVGTR